MNRLNWTTPTTVTRRQSKGISGREIKISCSEGQGQDRNNQAIEEERERERFIFCDSDLFGGVWFWGTKKLREKEQSWNLGERERERETMVYQKKK